MPILVVSEPSGKRATYELKGEKVFVGRSAENHILVDDHRSSRRHCVVEPTPDGRWQVRDLKSLNGTQLNGKPVETSILSPGDRISIGETELRFQDEVLKREGMPTEVLPAIGAGEKKPPPPRHHRAAPLSTESSRIENESLRRLLEITKKMNAEQDLDPLLTVILDSAIDLTCAERGFLILLDEGHMKFQVARTREGGAIEHPELQISHHIASEVLQSKRTVISADAQEDQRFSGAKSVKDLNLRSVCCTPLLFQQRLVGALYIDNTYDRGVFDEGDIDLLEAFSAQASVALNNVRSRREIESKHQELKSSYRTIEVLNRELADRVARQTEELDSVKEELLESRGQLGLKYDYGNIIGRSTRMQEIFRILDRITDVAVPVLIQGDSGTGKELIARSIHYNGPRKDKPFVSENCAAISETLLESELFGYVRGAFTGAQKDKKGLFEVATEGTLFLDEIGDMSPDMQKKILRVIQESEIRPVGGKEKIKIEVRILSATNKDLTELVRQGKFREDLYYRLNVVSLRIPPLRDRREDIPPLVDHFLKNAIKEAGCPPKRISEKARNALVAYDWPGNVRELENEIRRMVALTPGDIDETVLAPQIQNSSHARAAVQAHRANQTLREVVEDVERQMILDVLVQTKWNKTRAADLLGLSRLGLRKKIERYRLEGGE
jgi:transcriptional regulator with GAF, ATPase, and Fis domain